MRNREKTPARPETLRPAGREGGPGNAGRAAHSARAPPAQSPMAETAPFRDGRESASGNCGTGRGPRRRIAPRFAWGGRDARGAAIPGEPGGAARRRGARSGRTGGSAIAGIAGCGSGGGGAARFARGGRDVRGAAIPGEPGGAARGRNARSGRAGGSAIAGIAGCGSGGGGAARFARGGRDARCAAIPGEPGGAARRPFRESGRLRRCGTRRGARFARDARASGARTIFGRRRILRLNGFSGGAGRGPWSAPARRPYVTAPAMLRL